MKNRQITEHQQILKSGINFLRGMVEFNKKYQKRNFSLLILNLSYYAVKFFLKFFLGGKNKESFLNFFRTGKIIQKAYLPGGYVILFRFEDFGIINEFYGMGVYKGIKISKGDTILDLGGHIGLFALYCSHRVGKKGKIFSVEPYKESYKLLKKNLWINSIKNTKPINLAIYKKRGIMKFYINRISASNSFFPQGNKKIEMVKTTTLKDFVKKRNIKKIDLIKMDIEGAEYDVIKTSERVLKKTRAVVLEIHKDLLTEKQIIEINEIFKRNKFKNKVLYSPHTLFSLLL
ncbi:MAG: FkbM family methyltransferase [Candidatus Pacearchaeota archaeon]